MIDEIDNEPSNRMDRWGDALQAPQEWCYREWQHLTFSPASIPQLGTTIAKVCLLVVAWPPSFVLGLAGSAIKFCANIFPSKKEPIATPETVQVVSVDLSSEPQAPQPKPKKDFSDRLHAALLTTLD